MSVSKKTAAMILANKKREEVASKTYTVERLLKRRKRKGRIEYLVKWKHWDRNHNSWEPEGNILDKSLIESYRQKSKTPTRRHSSPRKSCRNSTDSEAVDKSQTNRSQDDQSVKGDDEKIADKPLEDDDNDDDDDVEKDDDEEEKPISSLPIDYWYPPKCDTKSKFAITDITSGNVTITFRELI